MNLMCGVTDVIVVSNIHSQYALHLLPVIFSFAIGY